MAVSGINANEIMIRNTEWIWKGFIPRGNVTMILGETGAGKSTLLYRLMSDWSVGLNPLERSLGKPTDSNGKKLYYISRENSYEETVVPMLRKLGADFKNIRFQNQDVQFELDLEDIETVVREYSSDVIIVDPWHHFLPKGISTSDNQGLVELLGRLSAFAKNKNITIILTGNYVKSSKLVYGSSLYAAFGSVLKVERDENGLISVSPAKMSVGIGDHVSNVTTTLFMSEDNNIIFGHSSFSNMNESMRRKAEVLVSILSKKVLRKDEVEKELEPFGLKLNTLYDLANRIGITHEQLPDRSSVWYIMEEKDSVKQQLDALREEARSIRKRRDSMTHKGDEV